jgi:hypothetical protein
MIMQVSSSALALACIIHCRGSASYTLLDLLISSIMILTVSFVSFRLIGHFKS